MKILLLFPNYLEKNFIIPASLHPPLGLAMIGAVLKKAGHEVSIIDATAEKMNIYAVQHYIEKKNPDVIGITANIAFARKAFLMGKWLKKHNSARQIVFGGPWPTIEYEKILKNGAADYVVIGEGEITAVELIKALQDGKILREIQGIAFMENGTVVKTPQRDYILDLDSLPFPAWELLPKPKKYFFNAKKKRFYPIMTSRGCPLGCIHCTKLIHGYKIRTRSIENVIDEIKYIHEKFKANNLLIIDDNFNYDIARAERICDAIINLDFEIAIHFSNGIRADRITPRLAWKLKKAGAYDIALGIESGNQEVVYKIGKNLDLNAVKRAVKMLKRLNIFTTGFIMVGLPYENLSTLIDTKKYLFEIDIDDAHIFKVVPFPGTRLYDILIKKGYLEAESSESIKFYFSRESNYNIEGLPSELIDLAHDDLYRSFYLRASKILFYFKNIRWNSWKWYLNFALLVLINLYKKKGKIHSW